MHAFKLTRVGDKLGVVLPAGIAESMHLKEGDTVFLEKSSDVPLGDCGDTEAFSIFPAMAEQLRAGHEFMRDYHAAFRMLS